MGLKCKIKEIDGMKIPMQGDRMDPLYVSLLSYYKDEEQALTSWAKANSIGSIEELAIFEGADVGSDLAKFIDQSIGNQEIKVSDKDKFDILYLAVTNGYDSLASFSEELNRSLKPNGFFDLSPQNLLKTKLFTIMDIERTSLEKLVDVVNKTEAILSQGDIEVTSPEVPTDYYDNQKRNSVNGSRRLTTKEMLDKVLDIAKTDFVDLEEAIEISGFEELRRLVDFDKFEELTVIQEVSPQDGNLDLKFNQSRKVLENTLTTYTDTLDLEADIDFILSFDNDVWNRKAAAVYGVTKEIELDLAKKGVDIIGLADRNLSKTELVLFLKTVQNMLTTPTSITIDAFYEQLSVLNVDFKEGNTQLKKIFANDPNLDLVEVNSDQSLTDLYNNHGLVRFKDNLFFKVQKESKDILYEKLYNKYTNSGEGINTNAEKSEVLVGLTDLVNTYRSEVDESVREEYNLYKLLSGRAKAEALRVQDTEPLTTIKSDVEYLKGDFISDFNKYILEEKFADSQIYDKILRHIKITDAGIVVPDAVTTLMGIQYKQELEDYIKIRRGNFGNQLIEADDQVAFRDRDLYFLNNKQKIKEVQTSYRTSGDFLVTRENPNLYVKVGNDIYRKAVSKDQNDLYAKVRANYKDNLFYDTNTNYDTNLEDMFSILETMKLPTTEYQKPDLNTELKNQEDIESILDLNISFYKNTDNSINEMVENCG